MKSKNVLVKACVSSFVGAFVTAVIVGAFAVGLLSSCCNSKSCANDSSISTNQPKIIAHRGFWDKRGSDQNSLSSLKNAIGFGAFGSEIDVHLTTDGYIVLNHDDDYKGVPIQKVKYAELANLRLINDEPLPTLQQCIEIIKAQDKAEKTKLIVEIKPHHSPEIDARAANAVVKAINEGGIADLVDYISFSADICNELIKLNPKHRVAYLNGEKSPKQLKEEGYWGMDYNGDVFLKDHPEWIQEAKDLGLTINVWTINRMDEMKHFIAADVDYITTNHPELLKGLLN
ncbi:glycerophosphoryl diester phosphodiesterase [Bacteroidia bacterium]|nr:glycerophosphoryl diester phosphodiesterase [Bacteroidia bacterium]